MKNNGHRLTALDIALATAVVLGIGGIIAWWANSISPTVTSPSPVPITGVTTKTFDHDESIYQPENILTPASDKYGNPDSWSFFNLDYQSPYKRFRFKYPAVFDVRDRDSDVVWLIMDDELYLGIDENVHLTGSSNGKSAHEQYESYHYSRNWGDTEPPDLTMYERIDFDEYRFVYIRERKPTNGMTIAGHDEWIHYFGVLDGAGIDVYDLKKLPEDTVYEIIQSIEFKEQ